jgi:hypothetical protein
MVMGPIRTGDRGDASRGERVTAEQAIWLRIFELAYQSRLERGANPTDVHVLREAAEAGSAAVGYAKAEFAVATKTRDRTPTAPKLRLGVIPREEP